MVIGYIVAGTGAACVDVADFTPYAVGAAAEQLTPLGGPPGCPAGVEEEASCSICALIHPIARTCMAHTPRQIEKAMERHAPALCAEEFPKA